MYDNSTKANPAKAWLSLFRPPNLFSVPGDPAAGALLAASAMGISPLWHPILLAMGASLSLYAAGLLSNDYLDRGVDARERPERPIPAGSVPPNAVLVLALILTLLGILLAYQAGWIVFLISIATAALLWSYNKQLKDNAWLGPVSMGACRGCSLMMGAAAMGPQGLLSPLVLLSAIILTSLIALLTHTARQETQALTQRPVSAWAIPPLLLLWLLVTSLHNYPQTPGLALGLGAMAFLWTLLWIFQLKPGCSPGMTQRTIGALIRGLILAQASVCATCGDQGQAVALLLLLGFPVAGWVGKWFYGS